MADPAIGAVTETVLNMVISLAGEKISLVRGMKKELKRLQEQLEMLQALSNQVHQQPESTEPIQLWLKNLQSVSLDAQIVLEEFGYEVLRKKIEVRKRRDKLRAIVSCSRNPLSFRLKMAEKIKSVLQSIEDVYSKGAKISLLPVPLVNSPLDWNELRSSSPYVEESKIVGREENVKELTDALINTKYGNDLPVITIHGMGGQGKTTLAQLIYKNDKIKSFFNKTMWVCVSEDFNVDRLLGEMFQSLTKTSAQVTNKEALVEKLKEQLNGKRYLLVLDDVWNRDGTKWDEMRTCLLQIGDVKGSKILATTRDLKVASTMGTSKYHKLGTLSKDQSWELFEKYAFAEGGATRTHQLEDAGRRILEKCGGLPLAIKTIASLLSSKKSELEWLKIEHSGTWSTYDEGDRVLASIKLSYDHLPSFSLKQCFAFCAIFEKDTILEKDRLVQLWMAQGLLSPSNQTDVEDIGSIYFDFLLKSSLFQEAEKDDYNNITSSKMHDIVHDFASKVSENYCYHVKDWRDKRERIEAVHVSINACQKGMWENLYLVLPSNLRTLILEGGYIDLPEDLFRKFTCLSTLIIKDQHMTELPNSIGKLKHLRFLDIRETEIHCLPISLAKLYYLQTLRVGTLTTVPDGFGSLSNLRHFHVITFSVFRKLSQLEHIQTICLDECEGSGIEELGNLDNLRGDLSLYTLNSLQSSESAVNSKLYKKSGIRTLEIYWRRKDRAMKGKVDGSDDVMKSLEPHPNLKGLTINGFPIRKFPSWMTRENDMSSSLHNLVRLKLKDLETCETLPSLGDLPYLEYLKIRKLLRVTRIGEEFYGWSSKKSSSGGDCYGPKIVSVFPALKILKLGRMDSLVEWSDAIREVIPTTATAHSSLPSSTKIQVRAFPCLEVMIIDKLAMLDAFPNLGSMPSLVTLEFNYLLKCKRLPSLGGLPRLENLTICGLPSMTCIGEEFYDCSFHKNSSDGDSSNGPKIVAVFPALKVLGMGSMDNLVKWSDLPLSSSKVEVRAFPCLEVMMIADLPKLDTFPNLGNMPSLVKLGLCGLQECKRLPSLGDLPCLQELSIEELPSVMCIGEEFYGWSSQKSSSGGGGGGGGGGDCYGPKIVSVFPALKILELESMDNVVEWSDVVGTIPTTTHSSFQVRAFPCLEVMTIRELPKLDVFPNLGSLPSLMKLELHDLQKCKRLPSFGNLPRLENLEIATLPNVKCIREEFFDSGQEIISIFPALKKLKLGWMHRLVELSIRMIQSSSSSSSSSSAQVRIFPCLTTVEFWYLPKLRRVEIWKCPMSSDYSQVIRHDDHHQKQQQQQQQQPLYFPWLHKLTLGQCDKLTASICNLIPSSAPLEFLNILCHPSSWPKDLHHLTSLTELELGGGFGLRVEDLTPHWPFPTISSSSSSDAANYSLSFKRLTLYDFPSVTSLPYQLQYMASLTELKISKFFALEILPEWLGNLKCLQKLNLSLCSNLNKLPSAEALQRLTHLSIDSCDELKKRCSREENGSEWHKISHIPNLNIQ